LKHPQHPLLALTLGFLLQQQHLVRFARSVSLFTLQGLNVFPHRGRPKVKTTKLFQDMHLDALLWNALLHYVSPFVRQRSAFRLDFYEKRFSHTRLLVVRCSFLVCWKLIVPFLEITAESFCQFNNLHLLELPVPG